MAGNVSGFIGNEQVELNNAATETTLAALLASMKSIAGGSAVLKVAGLAGSAGIDPATIAAATAATQSNTASVKQGTSATDAINVATKSNTDTVRQTTAATDDFRQSQVDAAQATVDNFTLLHNEITKLLQGTATASGMLNTFGTALTLKYPIIGLLFQGFSKLVGIQEENFQAYQKISASGVNFSGSLTSMRMAAANSYLTLDEFTGIIKNNSQTLATLGGSANEGAQAFFRMSRSLIQSSAGQDLMALGYSAQEVNQGMADYLTITGGRTKAELQDTAKITQGTKDYLEQLDRLADITGKSRDQLAAEFKQKQDTADMELYKASLSTADREKFTAVYNDALAKYGQGAADNVLAAAQGRAVTTEAGKKYAALAPMATKSLQDQYNATMKYGAKSQQARDAEDRARLNNGSEFMRFSGVIGSTTNALKGNEKAASQAAKDQMAGMTTKAALDEAEIQRQKTKAAQEHSEAAQMAATTSALKELGAALLDFFSPLIKLASFLVGKLAESLTGGLKYLNNLLAGFGQTGEVIKGVIASIGLIIAGLVVVKAKSTLANIAGNVAGGGKGGVLSGITNAATGAAGGKGAGVPGLGAAQTAAGKVGGIGSSLAGVGKGIGDAIKGVLKGLASGLSALGNPRVLLGGVTLGLLAGTIFIAAKGFQEFAKVSWAEMGKGFVTLLGLGAVAAVLSFASPLILTGALAIGALGLAMVPFGVSVALAGPQMQNLAKGLIMLSDVSALDLLKLTGPIAGLGVSLLSLGTGIKMSESGIKSVSTLGPALNTYAQGITAFGKAVNSVDLIKAEKLKSVLKGPTAAEALSNAGAQMIQAVTKIATGGKSTEEKTAAQLESLNSTMKELVKYMKDTAENTDKTHRAAKSLNGNLWAA